MIILIPFITLTGCLEQKIVMDANNDLSGNAYYDIKLSDDYVNSYKLRDKIDSIEIKNILNANEMQKRLAGQKNLKLIDFSETTVENGKNYDVQVKFTQIEDMKKIIPTFFVENSIYSEKDGNYCKSRLVLNFIGDPKKIRAQFSSLNDNEKKLFSAYLSIIGIDIIYVLPSSINTFNSTNGDLQTEILKEFSSSVFENEILNRLSKDDREKLLRFFDKKKSSYSLKNYLSDEEIQIATEMIVSSGFKNKISFKKTLLDVVSSKEDPEFTVCYRKIQ
jgi:hypothetical protein